MAYLFLNQSESSSLSQRHWEGVLTWAKLLVALFAMTMGFRASGRPLWWMLLAALLPAIHCALDPAYRQRVAHWLTDLWAALHSADMTWGRRGLAAGCFVTLPAAMLFLSTHRTLAWGDSWAVVPAACSLVREGNVELSEYVAEAPAAYLLTDNGGLPYSVQVTPKGVYSSYPSGMVPFAVPVVAVARLVGADLDSDAVRRRLEKWTSAWLAAVCLGLFFLLALHLTEPGPAWVATFLLAAGSVMFSTVSHGLWQHGGLVFWALVVLFVEFESVRRPLWGGSLVQGCALGMMVPCRLTSALFVVPFGIWVLVRAPKRAVLVAVVALIAYVPWAIFYFRIYGNPFGPSTGQLAGSNWTTNIGESLPGVLFSPARGLLVYQPWLLLGFLVLLPAFRRWAVSERKPGLPAGWAWFCLTVIALQIGLVSSWRCWWGGHCWGSRLLAEIVPLAALLCVVPLTLLLRFRSGRVLVGAVAVLAFLVHGAGVYRDVSWEARVQMDSHPEMVWSWSRAPFLLPPYKPPRSRS